MTSPTQSAMEQQQREAFEAWARGRDLSVERLSPSDPPPPGFTYESFVTERYWQCWEDCAQQNASELRSLRDSLALARSYIGELREALGKIATPGYGLELNDPIEAREAYWQRTLLACRETARAALNKEQP